MSRPTNKELTSALLQCERENDELRKDADTICIINVSENRRIKMKSLALTAVVTGFPEGGTHGRQTWWTGMGEKFSDHITKVGLEVVEFAKAQGNKGGPLTATLSTEVDGAKQPDVVITGVTDEGLSKFQRHVHKVEGDIIALGEQRAKEKKHAK